MKRCALIACALLLTAHADDWQDALSPTRPGPFAPPRPLQAHYRFTWMNVLAGEADCDFRRQRSGDLQLEVAAKTVGFARKLWRLDAQYVSVARAATLRPVTAQQTESYKDETLLTTLRFDAEGLTRLRQTKPTQKTRPKEKRFKFAGAFDLHTALLWIRSQRLQDGDVYRLVVYPAVDPYLAEVAVIGREEIKALNRTFKAVRVDLKLRAINAKTLELTAHAKFKRASAWISDDSERLFLQANAEIFVGSVWLKLDRIRQDAKGAAVNRQ